MENNQFKSFETNIGFRKKDDQKMKSKTGSNLKNIKVNSVKSSLEKIFRIKSKSDTIAVHEDFKVGVIPQTIYLTPQQKLSLSQDLEKLQRLILKPRDSAQLSCSNFVGGQSSTFGVPSKHKEVIPPLNEQLCTMPEDKTHGNKLASVPHSISMPMHLSKSHQSVYKGQQQEVTSNRNPAKRTVHRKGLLNCSLFRKKSIDKDNESTTEKTIQTRKQSKSLNRSTVKSNQSILSDRCLTLPNLKCSEVDLIPQSDNQHLISMDLIKDYLNRSNSSLQLSVHGDLVNSTTRSQVQVYPTTVVNTYGKKVKVPRTVPKELLSSQKSASKDMCHSRTTSPHTGDGIAFDVSFCKHSSATTTADEKQKPPFLKQFSEPIYTPATTHIHHQFHSPTPTNSAFEFWTRPYQEKLNASRRRQMDDKVGSKEALLRSLSPHNIRSFDDDAPVYQLHNIPEPMTVSSIDPRTGESLQLSAISHSRSFLNYRSPVNPVAEDRLRASEMSNHRLQQQQHQKQCANSVIFSEDQPQRHETAKTTVTVTEILPSKTGKNQTGSDKGSPFRRNQYDNLLKDTKDNKSINSSTELILTRTPTPPHSFAESPVSSIYPVPKEFISEVSKSQSHPSRLCDNSPYGSDENCPTESSFPHREQLPPIPPPRIDSIIRSLQNQSELENDHSTDYHHWLDKLPYKIPVLGSKVDKIPRKIDRQILPQRKSVKSWNVSGNSKHPPIIIDKNRGDHQESEFLVLKRSHSYDQYLENSELENNTNQKSTFLKQYSHLYSLKPSPSQVNVGKKLNRSKSFDLRGMVENRNFSLDLSSNKSLGDCTEILKSALNGTIVIKAEIADDSGNDPFHWVRSQPLTVYPVL